MGATQLKNFVNTIFEVLATDERTFERNFEHITCGTAPKLKEFDEESEILLATLARESGKLKNLTNALSVRGPKKTPQTIMDEIASLEVTIKALEEKIKSIDIKRSRLKKKRTIKILSKKHSRIM
ncbi:MAG: hypothetical protein ABR980_11545 [Ignavibacteriaceae bacterium]